MQIVINIDDDVYKRALVYKDVQLASNRANDLSELITAVANGIPLPKRHEKLTNHEWIDFLSEQFDISRTSAKEMLHAMMSVKKEDNFKKQFSQGFSQDRKRGE